ncbi:YheC/YheD family endospore coat-associated protein [Niallia nealsonii]|uniref:YheC/YheD family endospore coat-associated protein n=1 Tax=Niallia nealsonii TaxID=115979 RepID=UPI0012FEE73C|nr:YheC/YheD family protein [Niallia nealsonii]
MDIYYNRKIKCWSTLHQTDLTFGSNKEKLSTISSITSDCIAFQISQTKNNIGPIIGILVSYNKKNKLSGNGPLFINLQKELTKLGGIVIIFAPEDISETEVAGFVLDPKENRWIHVKSPLPHVVYNRIPFRKTEKQKPYQHAVQFFANKNIPFFNPSFLNKYEIYTFFKEHPVLKPFLPPTMLITDQNVLYDFLKKHKNIYIKPVEGKKGNKIINIKINQDDSITAKTPKETKEFSTFIHFWNYFNSTNDPPSYIAQKTIEAAKYNGHRYDFRLLILYDKDKYVLKGVGIRQSVSQEITTHIPNGGQLLPYHALRTQSHDHFIDTLVKYCGDCLSNQLGFFGEFSIDACVDIYGNYYLFEINSKPMLFDELDIEQARCTQLAKLCYQLGNFNIPE